MFKWNNTFEKKYMLKCHALFWIIISVNNKKMEYHRFVRLETGTLKMISKHGNFYPAAFWTFAIMVNVKNAFMPVSFDLRDNYNDNIAKKFKGITCIRYGFLRICFWDDASNLLNLWIRAEFFFKKKKELRKMRNWE